MSKDSSQTDFHEAQKLLDSLVPGRDDSLKLGGNEGFSTQLIDSLRTMIEETLERKLAEQMRLLRRLSEDLESIAGHAQVGHVGTLESVAAPETAPEVQVPLPGEVVSAEPPPKPKRLTEQAPPSQPPMLLDTFTSRPVAGAEADAEMPRKDSIGVAARSSASSEGTFAIDKAEERAPSATWMPMPIVPKPAPKRDDRQSTAAAVRSSTRVLTAGVSNKDRTSTESRSSMRSLASAMVAGTSTRGKVALLIVNNATFDLTLSFLILVNSVFLGVQVDYQAANKTAEVPLFLGTCETIFCVIFVVEILMRLYVHRCSFFTGREWMWNIFDLFVVGSQAVNEVLYKTGGEGTQSNMSFARVLKLLKMVRVVRVARIARVLRELRTLVSSIAASVKALFWTGLLLLTLIYMVGIFITEVVNEHRIGPDASEEGELVLAYFYGSLGTSMLSLFQAITSGVDWNDALRPLMENVSPWLALVFVLYIGIAVLCMMNVVTGVFVDTVLMSAKNDREGLLVNNAVQILGDSDNDMTLDDFLLKVDQPEMQEFFKGIGANPSEAERLFSVVDADDSGTINAEEFLNGVVRLHGPAKALDTAVLVQSVHNITEKMRKLEQAGGKT